MKKYLDFDLMKKYPNKYNLTPKSLKKIKVLDWERLKKRTWLNNAKKKPCWCHIEESDFKGYFDAEDEFWIGFYEDGRVDYWFSSREGMCGYNFDEFYGYNEIENKADMEIHAKTLSYINSLIDDGIIEINERND